MSLETVTTAAMAPEMKGHSPAYALQALFEKTETTTKDIGSIELNEAFASQAAAGADPDTKFVFAYPEAELTPDCGVSASLPKAMGMQRALAFAISGEPLSAQQALEQGLITQIADDPQSVARQVAERWSAKAPAARGATRQLMRQSGLTSRADRGDREAAVISHRLMSDEAQDLIKGFLNK